MKLIVKERKLNEVKGTEEFRYDKAFIDSLNKPGKLTLVRFSNETGSGSDAVLLGTHFGGYAYSHTPTGIYGYPLNNPEVLDSLRLQKLYFGNSDVIVVYWVDEDSVFNLSKDMTAEKFKSLIEEIKNMKGEQFIASALKKAEEKEDKRIYSMDLYTPPKNIFKYLELDKVTDPLQMSKIFWNIITLGAKNSKDMTLMLFKLGFKSITDESAIIDIAGGPQRKSQAPIQTLTLNRAFIDHDFKIYTNPARLRRSSRKPQSGGKNSDPKIVAAQVTKKFIQSMEEYKKELPKLAAYIDDVAKIEPVSDLNFKITIRMPSTIRSSSRYNPDDPKQKEAVEWNLLEHLKSVNGKSYGTSYSGVEFYDAKLILAPRKPDLLEIKFEIAKEFGKYRAHQFLGFMFKFLQPLDNPFKSKKEYMYMVPPSRK